jgi:hypothetical protein
MTEQELAALIDQKVAERTRELEDKLTRITANRDDILREKRELEGRSIMPDPDVGRRRTEALALGDRTGIEDLPAADRVVIPRHADAPTYQRLKREAEQRGVPYVVADEETDPVDAGFDRAPNSKVKFVETEKTLYANQAMQRLLGIAALIQQAAAKGKTLRIFRSPDDLDPKAQTMHAHIVAAGDPNSFVLEG